MPHAVLKSGERLAHVLKKVDPIVGFPAAGGYCSPATDARI
jgi:hypothetical protein